MKKQYLIIALLIGLVSTVRSQDISHMSGTVDYLKKGNDFFDKGELIKAEKAYEKGLTKGSTDSVKYVSQLALVNQLLGDYVSSESYYRRAYNQQAGDPVQYAEVLAMNHKYDEAEQVLEGVKNSTELVEQRKSGFANVAKFSADSAAYFVNSVNYNSSEREVFAAKIGTEMAVISSRPKGKSPFRLKDGRDESDFYDVYVVSNGEISPSTDLNGDLNQGAFTYITSTGELLITENYELSTKNADRDQKIRLKISSYKKDNEGQWNLSYSLPFCSKDYSVAHPSFDEENGLLYFSSDMPGGIGGNDIYVVSYQNGQWGQPQLVPKINTEANEMYPFVDVVHEELYFSSNGYPGVGGLDIYKTFLADKSTIYNIGVPINSSMDDFALVLDDTGRKGWLASDRPGGAGLDDIYEVTIFIVRIQSKIVGLPNYSIPFKMRVIEKTSGREVPHEDKGEGVIEFDGILNREYEIIAEVEGHEPQSRSVVASAEMVGKVVEIPVESEVIVDEVEETEKVDHFGLTFANLSSSINYEIGADTLFVVDAIPEEVSDVYSIKNVFFDFNSDHPNAAEDVVSRLASIMNDFQQIQLEIVSYSDSRGSKAYNTNLALRRANAIVKLLEKEGISANRISVTAIGEEHVYNGCKDGIDCTNEQHANNRRVEFLMK